MQYDESKISPLTIYFESCFFLNASIISFWTYGSTGACFLYSIENSPA